LEGKVRRVMTQPRWLSAAHALTFGACAWFSPALASAQEAITDRPPPAAPAPEPDLPSRAAPVNLALTGAAVTGIWYGAALGSSFIWSNGDYARDLRIPIAGPFMALDDMSCPKSKDPNCTTLLIVMRVIAASIDGVGQATGLALALESLLMPTAAPRRTPRDTSRGIRPIPFVAGRDAVGIGFAGEL
jgi:hypothetical protein